MKLFTTIFFARDRSPLPYSPPFLRWQSLAGFASHTRHGQWHANVFITNYQSVQVDSPCASIATARAPERLTLPLEGRAHMPLLISFPSHPPSCESTYLENLFFPSAAAPHLIAHRVVHLACVNVFCLVLFLLHLLSLPKPHSPLLGAFSIACFPFSRLHSDRNPSPARHDLVGMLRPKHVPCPRLSTCVCVCVCGKTDPAWQ